MCSYLQLQIRSKTRSLSPSVGVPSPYVGAPAQSVLSAFLLGNVAVQLLNYFAEEWLADAADEADQSVSIAFARKFVVSRPMRNLVTW